MYNILGVEKPALFYLVDEVCEETPILMKAYFAGNPPEDSEVLREYQLVNYDVLAGKHYWDEGVVKLEFGAVRVVRLKV